MLTAVLAKEYDVAAALDPENKRLTIDLSAELHQQLKIAAAEDGVRMVSVARGLFKLWLADPELRRRVANLEEDIE